jgi:hypothetical protein
MNEYKKAIWKAEIYIQLAIALFLFRDVVYQCPPIKEGIT